MRAGQLKRLLEDYGDHVEVKIEVRGESETPDGTLMDTDGLVLDILDDDDSSVYFYGQDGTVHIIGDTPAEEE